MEQLEAWAAQGHAADIVDSDLFVGYLPMRPSTGSELENKILENINRSAKGAGVIEFIIKWAEEQPEHLRPQKYFMHSVTTSAIGNYASFALYDLIDIHDSQEFYDIEALGRGYYSSLSGSTKLRRYMNEAIGASFPLQEYQFEMQRNPEMVLSLTEATSEVEEGRMTPLEALTRIDASVLAERLRDKIDDSDLDDYYLSNNDIGFRKSAAKVISGRIAFNQSDIQKLHSSNSEEPVILALEDFEPDSTKLLSHIQGVILTGEATEHLELVVSNHGLAGIFNAASNETKIENNILIGKPIYGQNIALKAGDWATIEGSGTHGKLYGGKLPIIPHQMKHVWWYEDILPWINEISKNYKRLSVKANADTPNQIKTAIQSGADGIGLLRTEHMFFEEKNLKILQDILLQENPEKSFKKLKKVQEKDFKNIFKAIGNLGKNFSVKIRLLDAPPEEFLPKEKLEKFRADIPEDNQRGAQLALLIPELYQVQAEALFASAAACDYQGIPEIMLPLIKTAEETEFFKIVVAQVAAKYGFEGRYRFGVMIETLEAVKNAKSIAQHCDFLSFGTNDLTAAVMGGIKRNDIVATRLWMVENNHKYKSPFLRLADSVIKQMRYVIKEARHVNPDIQIGICGHQVSADDKSIQICHEMGLDSVSVPSGIDYVLPSIIMAAQAAAIEAVQGKEKLLDKRPKADLAPRDLDFE